MTEPTQTPAPGQPHGGGRRRRRRGRGGGGEAQGARAQGPGQQQGGAPRQGQPGLPGQRQGNPQGRQQQQQQQQQQQGNRQQHKQHGGAQQQQHGGRNSQQHKPQQKPALPATSALVTAQDAGPMTPQEVAEMRRHLAFLRAHRQVLRLQLNATEDLLVNGTREPTDRGVCRHLLDKVDRPCIDSALAREPVKSDLQARATLLAGAVALSRDVGILITYLETLTQLSSRADQARAFVEAVGRIDFEALSAARLTRLMQLMLDIFDGAARTQAVLGLLEEAAFRRALDLAFSQLAEDAQRALAPLLALGRAVFRDGPAHVAAADPLVRPGLEAVMAMAPATLKALPAAVRLGLVEVAVNLTGAPGLTDRVMDAFYGELPRDGRDHSRLGTRYAAQLLARQDDARARAVLEKVAQAHPDFRQPARWLAELALPRLGRVAVKDPGGAFPLLRGFHLDTQQEVWLRRAPVVQHGAMTAEAALLKEVPLPGVARAMEVFTHQELACTALSASGQPVTLQALPRTPEEKRAVLAAMVRVVHALGLAGLVLPDVRLERWLLHPQPVLVTLVDVSGLQKSGDAVAVLAQHAVALVHQVMPGVAVPAPVTFAALVAALER